MTDQFNETTDPIDDTLPYEYDQMEAEIEGELPGEEVTEEAVEPKAEKAPKDPRLVGLSGHQRNRRLALDVYGDPEDERTNSGRNDFRLEFVNPEDRARATEELQGKARATKNGRTAIGGDRYLMWVKAQGFPADMMRVVWPEDRAAEIEANKAAREETRAKVRAEKEALRAEAAQRKAEEKAQKEAEKAAAKEAAALAAAEAGETPAKPKKKSKKSKVETEVLEGSVEDPIGEELPGA